MSLLSAFPASQAEVTLFEPHTPLASHREKEIKYRHDPLLHPPFQDAEGAFRVDVPIPVPLAG